MGRRPWPRRYRRVRQKLLAVLLVTFAIGLMWGTYRRAESLVAVYGEQRCRNLVIQLILDTVSENKTAEKLTSFTTVDNKKLLQLNGTEVTAFQTNMGKELAQKLDNLGEQTYSVPLGNILENLFLIGRGPEIAIRYIPIGSAQLHIGSSVTEAGVNQVLYRVIMTVSVDMTILVPGGTQRITCSQDVVLEETMITGQVPLFYGE